MVKEVSNDYMYNSEREEDDYTCIIANEKKTTIHV